MIRNQFAIVILFAIVALSCTSDKNGASRLPSANESTSGPIIVGGGAGQGEFSVEFVRRALPQILNDCLAKTCGIQPEKVQQLKVFEKKAGNAPKAIFRKADELGEKLFVLNSQANEVLINQDLLWVDEQKTLAYEVEDAAKLWIDILAIGENIPEDDLNNFKRDIALAISTEVERHTTTMLDQKKNQFEVAVWKRKVGYDQMFIRDPMLNVIDVNPNLHSEFACENMAMFQLVNVSWLSATDTSTETEQKALLRLNFTVFLTCNGFTNSHNGILLIEILYDGDTPAFRPETLSVIKERGVR